jgi:hypothetical protein
MILPDAFQTIAEVAIGLAGFSGLLVAFRRSMGPLSNVQKFRMRILFALSFGALFLSLLPAIILNLGISEDKLWVYSSLAMSIYSSYFLAWWLSSSRRTAKKYPEIFDRWVFSTMTVGHILNLVLQLFVVFKLVDSGHAGIFLIGLAWYLINASQQFVRMLFIQPQDQSDVQS